MRQMFEKFPEVLMIDATHGTNASKYKVFSIMSHDIFGKGQFVQHAVVQNERRNTLLTVLEEFKRSNRAWHRIQCILIDKDFTEISVLKTAFPDAHLLLCQFHVIKYLREEIASADYGFSSWQKQQLQGLVNLLVYARNEREFIKYRNYMRHIMSVGRGGQSRHGVGVLRCSELGEDVEDLGGPSHELGAATNELGPDNGELGSAGGEVGGSDERDDCEAPNHPFEIYFVKTWDSCRAMWCAFERENAKTMGNNTNNRIEASWKQLKELVSSFMGVDECVASIMCYHDQQERKFMDCLYKLSVVHNPKYDREMQFLSNLVSEHACELVYEQYVFATTRANYTFYEPVPDVLMIQHDSDEEDALDKPRREYLVTKRDWSCSCLFMSSRLLPCRHVIFLRKALKCENIIPTQLMNPRWLLASLRSDIDLPDVSGDSFAVSTVIPESASTWDSNRKFREANLVASTISEHLSSLGMKEYTKAMEVLRDVATLFKHGEYDGIARAPRQREREEVQDMDELESTCSVELDDVLNTIDTPRRASKTTCDVPSTSSSERATQLDADTQMGSETELGADTQLGSVTRSDLEFPVRSCAVQFARLNQVGETVFQGAVTCDT